MKKHADEHEELVKEYYQLLDQLDNSYFLTPSEKKEIKNRIEELKDIVFSGYDVEDPIDTDDVDDLDAEIEDEVSRKKQKMPPEALKELVLQNTRNLKRIYELEYKIAILGQEREKGPLGERAELDLLRWKVELEARVDQEIELLRQAFDDWFYEAETKYKGQNDVEVMRRLRGVQKRLLTPPTDLKGKIVLMHEALTSAHHNASMGTFAYGLGGENDFRQEGLIQEVLDELSASDTSAWDEEVNRLKGLPRGASADGGRSEIFSWLKLLPTSRQLQLLPEIESALYGGR